MLLSARVGVFGMLGGFDEHSPNSTAQCVVTLDSFFNLSEGVDGEPLLLGRQLERQAVVTLHRRVHADVSVKFVR